MAMKLKELNIDLILFSIYTTMTGVTMKFVIIISCIERVEVY
jgi:hypothetical protein